MKTEYNWRDMSDCAFLLIPFNIRYCALNTCLPGAYAKALAPTRRQVEYFSESNLRIIVPCAWFLSSLRKPSVK
jgi:hypothetical protein